MRNLEINRAFVTVEVVVYAAAAVDEQGGGNTHQVQSAGEVVFKQALHQADGLLRVVYGKYALVAFGYVGVHRCFIPSVRISIIRW